MELTVRVDLAAAPAGTATIVGVRVGVRPAGRTVVDRDTLPAKSPTLPMVMSVDPEVPCTIFRIVELVDILKSTIRTDTGVEWDSVPNVAVTVTVNVEGIEEVTVKVDELEPPGDIRMLVGLREAVKPADDTVAVRLTLPENPFMPVTVIAEFPIAPRSTMRETGLGETVKSGAATTVRDTETEWSRIPLLPVNATTYVPVVEEANLQDEEAVLPRGRKRIVGLQEAVRPEVETEAPMFTKPEKPPRLAKLREVVAEEPAAKTREDWVVEMLKSTMLTVTTTL